MDEKFMLAALREARQALEQDEVPVGAAIVRQGRILSRAHNQPRRRNDPSAHAEILALRRAARKLGNYRLQDCTLYVTIEPCAMCAGAIVQARLARVVYGADDPKAGACGSVLGVLNHPKLNHRAEVIRGVRSIECGRVLRDFFARRRSGAKIETRNSKD